MLQFLESVILERSKKKADLMRRFLRIGVIFLSFIYNVLLSEHTPVNSVVAAGNGKSFSLRHQFLAAAHIHIHADRIKVIVRNERM